MATLQFHTPTPTQLIAVARHAQGTLGVWAEFNRLTQRWESPAFSSSQELPFSNSLSAEVEVKRRLREFLVTQLRAEGIILG